MKNSKMRKARKVLGLTQAQVAEKADISSNYYSMIERGEKENPGSKVVGKLAKILKLKPTDIVKF